MNLNKISKKFLFSNIRLLWTCWPFVPISTPSGTFVTLNSFIYIFNMCVFPQPLGYPPKNCHCRPVIYKWCMPHLFPFPVWFNNIRSHCENFPTLLPITICLKIVNVYVTQSLRRRCSRRFRSSRSQVVHTMRANMCVLSKCFWGLFKQEI